MLIFSYIIGLHYFKCFWFVYLIFFICCRIGYFFSKCSSQILTISSQLQRLTILFPSEEKAIIKIGQECPSYFLCSFSVCISHILTILSPLLINILFPSANLQHQTSEHPSYFLSCFPSFGIPNPNRLIPANVKDKELTTSKCPSPSYSKGYFPMSIYNFIS